MTDWLDEVERAHERVIGTVGEMPTSAWFLVDSTPRLVAEVRRLRALIAPLLKEPWIDAGDERGQAWACVFCKRKDLSGHARDCPILRRYEILGH